MISVRFTEPTWGRHTNSGSLYGNLRRKWQIKCSAFVLESRVGFGLRPFLLCVFVVVPVGMLRAFGRFSRGCVRGREVRFMQTVCVCVFGCLLVGHFGVCLWNGGRRSCHSPCTLCLWLMRLDINNVDPVLIDTILESVTSTVLKS